MSSKPEIKFNESVKDVISSSREEALRCKNDFIGTEHLFLGMILDSRTNNNSAITLLTKLGVDIELLKHHIEVYADAQPTVEPSTGNIPLTKQAEKALKLTYLEAKLQKASMIGSIHLFLALLRDDDSTVSQLLKNIYELDYDAVCANELLLHELSNEENKRKARKSSSSPLTLLFDSNEYSQEEIKEIVTLISDLYYQVSGDSLKVTGYSQFDVVSQLELA